MRNYKILTLLLFTFILSNLAFPSGSEDSNNTHELGQEDRVPFELDFSTVSNKNISENSLNSSDQRCYNALIMLTKKSEEINRYFYSIAISDKPYRIADIGTANGYIWSLLPFLARSSLASIPFAFLDRLDLRMYDVDSSFFELRKRNIQDNFPTVAKHCQWFERDMASPPEEEKVDLIFLGHPNVFNIKVEVADSKGKRLREYIDTGDWEKIISNNLVNYLAPKGAAVLFFQTEDEYLRAKRWIQEIREREFLMLFDGATELKEEHSSENRLFNYSIFLVSKQ